MNIAEEIFSRKRPDTNRALQCGFTRAKDGSSIYYGKPILDGELTVSVIILNDGSVKCCVTDTYSGEEYTPVNVGSYVGSYVGRVREEYREVLEKISVECFTDVPFVSEQANRISQLIYNEYSASPDCPFRKFNGTVYRHKESGKWFAIEMYVKQDALEDIKDADPDGYMDVLNVRIQADTLDDLLAEPGIHRCYHMNKKLWITIFLDDTVSDSRIMELIRKSFDLTGRNGAVIPARTSGEKAYWIIPSKPSNYDVAEGFRVSGNNTISWHHKSDIQPGDIVYIYQTEPVAAIIFRCEVVRSHLPRPVSWSGMAPSAKYRMEIYLTDVYDKTMYPRSWMNEHGIKKTVRSQRSAPKELVDAIEKLSF